MKKHDPLDRREHPDEQRAKRPDREERSLLRRIRHPCRSRGPTSRRKCAFARSRKCASASNEIRAGGHRGEVKILTSCPSCLQGLKRYNDDADIDADYIVVEIAKNLLGADWMPEYVQRANDGGIERVLV